ncbi:MAG: GTP-binding protein [Ruminococcaceae bacterium]|nr:GTP-binding protein [Oscillospiraceae bacterium]
MKKEVIGIFAHVDSGKTTLCEAILYSTGKIRKIGRVDHKDAYLDNHKIEKMRGITIFSKQAQIDLENTSFTLLDTPGHVDFSAEAERCMHILDYAILVISASEGVESHTETLWNLLKLYNVPVFIFVNKSDIAKCEKEELLAELKSKLSDGCINFSSEDKFSIYEEIAYAKESLMDEFLNEESICDKSISKAIRTRNVFPVFFGSALKLTGIADFLNGIDKYTLENNYYDDFGARVFKITEDEAQGKLTHLKITGGTLKVKDIINDEKVNQIRIYSGEKYEAVNEVKAGDVCAVLGLTKTYPGLGIGKEETLKKTHLEPYMNYRIILNSDIDPYIAYENFKKLEDEDPKLKVMWNELSKQIHIQIMGKIQLEIIKQIALDRFGMNIDFSKGNISYKETIVSSCYGIGHYEPLRHYAEVHVLIEPLKRGSGLKFASNLSEDVLSRNWQRLILTHLEEKSHIGILTGSPICDVKITLVNGKAHLKHTEGGDFRQATYRAVRNALMKSESILLEPWYDFKIEVPTECIGKVMTDLQNINATFGQPKLKDDMSSLSGTAPVKHLQDYNISAFTGGRGKLTLMPKGYDKCVDEESIINEFDYSAESDVENTADSVFCAHGSGFNVKWDEVEKYAHLDIISSSKDEEIIANEEIERHISRVASDEELLRIFEMTYGKIKTTPASMRRDKKIENNLKPIKVKPQKTGDNYLLVDGYNIIFAWDDLKKYAEKSLDLAREKLINRMCNYQAFKKCNIILVFDAYKVSGNIGEVEKVNNIDIVYTKEAETADMYIEKVSKELSKNNNVRVATSDNLEQLIIIGNGAFKINADDFYKDVISVENAIKEYLSKRE